MDAGKIQQDDGLDTSCGIGAFRFRWLQRFASPKFYLINYCILGILQGAYFTYVVGVITTLEKRFSFESKVSGIILIADNLSPIVLSLLIGYYGGKSHRPRLIFGGMLVVVISCFLSALPYFLYGPGTHLLDKSPELLSKPKHELCDGLDKDVNCDQLGPSTMAPIYILFFANFLNGFGYTAFYTIGTPYLDDNVKKKDAPIYFSTMFALRIFGPSLGFLISSLSLSFYEDPYFDPGFPATDPRWIGAWWIGFLILGTALLVFTLPIVLFPRRLPGSPADKVADTKPPTSLPKLNEMPSALLKLAKNPVFSCHAVSVTLQVIGYAGYYVFMPKYLESQYRQSASQASLFSGSTSLITMLIGIMAGGYAIKKLKPSPKLLAGFMVGVDIFTVAGFFIYMFLGCDPIQLGGTSIAQEGQFSIDNMCNQECLCTHRVFEPICAPDTRTVYFSPCHAGCLTFNGTGKDMSFLGCGCEPSGPAFTSGYCPELCNMFLPYIVVMSIIKMISSTTRVGSTLIVLRAVGPDEKDLALGAFGAILALFAFIPYPLVFGALTDAACLVWEEKCGETGNCWLYDSDKFRYYLHGLAAGFIFLGSLFEIGVYVYSDRITNFYTDDLADNLPAKDVEASQPLNPNNAYDMVPLK